MRWRKSLDITAAKRNPTKKTEPIVTKKQPHNCDEELEERRRRRRGGSHVIDDGALESATFICLRHTQRWELGWVLQPSPAHYVLRLFQSPINFCFVLFFYLFV